MEVFQNTALAMHSYGATNNFSFFLNVLLQESTNSKQRKYYYMVVCFVICFVSLLIETKIVISNLSKVWNFILVFKHKMNHYLNI